MIQRDYILRMIEEFFQVLSRINSLKRGQLWQQASGAVEEEFQRLVGAGAEEVVQLTETELLARLIRSEPTQAVREKTLMLATLLAEAGEVAVKQERTEPSRRFYLKGLSLLLDLLAREDLAEWPDFAPRVEAFVIALRDTPLPLQVQAQLMQHYERLGEFAKAEDCLFAMLESAPDNPGLLDFGVLFYERLRGRDAAELAAGNLPRAELEAGLAELRSRRGATGGASVPQP